MKDPASKYFLGVDLGGTKIVAAVFDRDFKIKGRARKKTKAQNGAKEGMLRIAQAIYEACEDAGIKPSETGGIGLAAPGPVDSERGIALELPNLGWGKIEFAEFLAKEFKTNTVVANDVDAGTYGEYAAGAGKDARCVLGVFPGTGVGAGCVYDGSILRGRKTSSMELGHCQVVPCGVRCGCGARGCLETVAGRLAISSAVAAAVYRGECPYVEEHAGTDLKNIRSSVLAGAIQAGDKAVEKIVRDAAEWLGVGIGIAVNLLVPDIVVLGGGLVEAMPDIFLKESEKSARGRVMPSYRDIFKMAVAKLGDDSVATGAAALARKACPDT